MDQLSSVEIVPEGEVTASVIWLHGLGASGHDFEPIVPHLQVPGVRYLFPHAPPAPVTINGGFVMPSWYDIRSLQGGSDRESEADIRASAEKIEALLAQEKARGVPADRIVLAGFSQGGALALHVGHRHPEALAGILVLSAYLLLPEHFEAEGHPANAETPVLCCHGRADPMVPFTGGQAAYERLRTEGRDVRFRAYPMAHEVCMEEVRDIGAWLRERLPPSRSTG